MDRGEPGWHNSRPDHVGPSRRPTVNPRERLDFSAIDSRSPLTLPAGARLVLWPVLALEEWNIARPMARTVIPPPQGQPLLPDVPNWSWHEYGMRVGFWRLKRVYEGLGLSPTVTLNARVCETYPAVVEACLKNRWELNAHSVEQIPMHRVDDERKVIRESVEIIERMAPMYCMSSGSVITWIP